VTCRCAVVAVVDDDHRILESIQGLLESAGLTVRLYSAAKPFLEARDLADIEVLISDIGMPDMDGHELKRIVQSERPNLPVILLTGRDDALWAQSSIAAHGYQNFFRKPFSGRELLAAIEIALQSRAEDRPAVSRRR